MWFKSILSILINSSRILLKNGIKLSEIDFLGSIENISERNGPRSSYLSNSKCVISLSSIRLDLESGL